MLVKFFKTAGKSPTGMTDYLLGKNRNREKSKIIKGDPELVNQIAENSKFKNKHTAGCLSFEEKDIRFKDKIEIMEKFEKTLLCGLEAEQYAITWIEHKDKNRLELNFHIANVELTTGKRLQPYYDRVHQSKINDFKTIINHDYGLSNPDAPEKKQTTKESQAFIKRGTKDIKKEINEFVTQAVEQGIVRNRDDIKNLLIASELAIVRETDNSISIKNPINEKGRNIRLSGGIYERGFYHVDRRSQKEDGISNQRAGEEIESIRKRLDSRKEREVKENTKKYKMASDNVPNLYSINRVDVDSNALYRKRYTENLQRVAGAKESVTDRGSENHETGREDVYLQRNEKIREQRANRPENQKRNRGYLNELYIRVGRYIREIAERNREIEQRKQTIDGYSQRDEEIKRDALSTERVIIGADRQYYKSERTVKQASRTIDEHTPKKRKQVKFRR